MMISIRSHQLKGEKLVANARTAASTDFAEDAGGLTRGAKLALVSGFLGWMFDSMDLNVFTLVLLPSIRDLTGAETPAAVAQYGGIIIAAKIFAWGLGGVLFGVIADRIGRSKTLVITILIYSVFTALSGLAQGWLQLALLQAGAGIGIGGEWAAGAALIAETWPARSRARAMQIMQMAFAFGFFAAAGINIVLGPISWRYVLAAGILPAIVTLFIRAFVPEPELWRTARAKAKADAVDGGPADTAGATFALIFKPGLLGRTIVGALVTLAMLVGSWAALTLLPGWINQLQPPINPATASWNVSYCFILLNIGAVFGYLVLMVVNDRLGRRLSYFIFCAGSLASILYTFRASTTYADLQIMLPVLGFFIIGGFGTFASYLPELYPTRVRATGQGFCYNVSRMMTAPGPLIAGTLVGTFGSIPRACSAVALFMIVGLIVIWFGPETSGKPLLD
jgi:MFS family permease